MSQVFLNQPCGGGTSGLKGKAAVSQVFLNQPCGGGTAGLKGKAAVSTEP